MISFKLFTQTIKIIVIIAALPLLVVQAVWVKMRVIRLPEPEGERESVVLDASYNDDAVTLLVLGDSAAAGVGVNTQEHALFGQLLSQLSLKTHVTGTLIAKTGNTSEMLLSDVTQLTQHFHVAIISIGVNDVTNLVSVASWRQNIEAIYFHLVEQCQCQHIVFTALPPMHNFPALPQPLRSVLGQRAKRLNHELTNIGQAHSKMHIMAISIPQETVVGVSEKRRVQAPIMHTASFMAVDGFHPGKKGYALWAKEVSSLLIARLSHNDGDKDERT